MLPESLIKALEQQSSIGSQYEKLAKLAIASSPSSQLTKLAEKMQANSPGAQLSKLAKMAEDSNPTVLMAQKLNALSISHGMNSIAETISKLNFGQNSILLAIKANRHAFEKIADIYPRIDILYESPKSDIFIGDDQGKKIDVSRARDILLLDRVTDELSWSECCDFMNYISMSPMLGYKHPVGKKIYEYIKRQKPLEIEEISVFRTRVSTREKHIPYAPYEMFQAQYTFPRQNRFSMVGINSLYLADDLETAKLETGVTATSRYTYMELKIVRKFRVLNITDITVPLFDFCHKRTEEKAGELSVEYLLPNFISDCAKDHGFEGIIYNSVLKPATRNIVLFDAGRRDFNIVRIEGVNYE